MEQLNDRRPDWKRLSFQFGTRVAREDPVTLQNGTMPKMPKERNREVNLLNRFGVSFVLSLGLLIYAIFLVGALYAAKTGPATEAVRQTIDQVLAILEDPELKSPDRAAERRAKLEEVIGQRFDYKEMGKRTLASHWKKMDSSQQEEFVTLFQSFLSNSYAGNIDGYSGQKIEYVKERHKGNFAEVQTRVVSSKGELPLDYRLLNKNGDYRVYDVVIDGISLVKNYRGQFSRIIKTSSYDGLIAKLRIKTNQFSKPK
jgi:phospholipid transport system substrate-binding protein